MDAVELPETPPRPTRDRLEAACRILLDMEIESDPSPGTDDLENRDAKRAFIGVPFREIDLVAARLILSSFPALMPYEIGRLTPLVVATALGNPEDEWFQFGLIQFQSAFLPDTVPELQRGLLEGLSDERYFALHDALSAVLARNAFLDDGGEIVLQLALLKRVLTQSNPEAWPPPPRIRTFRRTERR